MRADSSPDGQEHIVIRDAAGDAMGGGVDLDSLEVTATTSTSRWVVTFTNAAPPTTVVDIYLDLNGQPNAGVPTFLPGRRFGTSATDAWEYALSLEAGEATLYRTQGAGTFAKLQTFPLVNDGTKLTVLIPRDILRGSPRRWGYQVLVMNGASSSLPDISDIIDPFEVTQQELWPDLLQGKRNDIPFVRVRSR